MGQIRLWLLSASCVTTPSNYAPLVLLPLRRGLIYAEFEPLKEGASPHWQFLYLLGVLAPHMHPVLFTAVASVPHGPATWACISPSSSTYQRNTEPDARSKPEVFSINLHLQEQKLQEITSKIPRARPESDLTRPPTGSPTITVTHEQPADTSTITVTSSQRTHPPSRPRAANRHIHYHSHEQRADISTVKVTSSHRTHPPSQSRAASGHIHCQSHEQPPDTSTSTVTSSQRTHPPSQSRTATGHIHHHSHEQRADISTVKVMSSPRIHPPSKNRITVTSSHWTTHHDSQEQPADSPTIPVTTCASSFMILRLYMYPN